MSMVVERIRALRDERALLLALEKERQRFTTESWTGDPEAGRNWPESGMRSQTRDAASRI